jgi:hypothetical protein
VVDEAGPRLPFDSDNNLDQKKSYDGERRGSRIAAPLSGWDLESRASVGKQLELEADNAIKYRTCSWQKVSRPP